MKDNLKMRGEIEKLEGFNLYKEYCIFRKKLENVENLVVCEVCFCRKTVLSKIWKIAFTSKSNFQKIISIKSIHRIINSCENK